MGNRSHHYKGTEIGVEPFRMENHYSTKEMDNILSDVQEMLYFYKNLWLNHNAGTLIKAKLKESAESLKQLNFPMARATDYNKRRDEILTKLRTIYISVNDKVDVSDDIYFWELVDKMAKFRMALYLKEKRENDLFHDNKRLCKWLSDNKYFTEVYGQTDQVKSIQNEILEHYKI